MCNCSNCSKITTTKGEKGDPGATGQAGSSTSGSNVVETAVISLSPSGTGTTVYFDRPLGSTAILPEAPPDGTYYNFAVLQDANPAGDDYIVETSGNDEITGYVNMFAGGAPVITFNPMPDDNTITMNGATSGGLVGTFFKMTYIAADELWFVGGDMRGSGSVVTPFS